MSLDETHVLINGALGGDALKEGELLERLRPRTVLWVASRMSKALRAKVEPEDLAQEILMAVHKSLPRFKGTEDRSFFKWFFTIAENRIRDQRDYFDAKKRQAPIVPLSFSQTSPSTHVARAENVIRVREALATLAEDYRRVIQLMKLEERTAGEVAEIMERSENAVRILFCRACKELKKTMERTGRG